MHFKLPCIYVITTLSQHHSYRRPQPKAPRLSTFTEAVLWLRVGTHPLLNLVAGAGADELQRGGEQWGRAEDVYALESLRVGRVRQVDAAPDGRDGWSQPGCDGRPHL